MLGARSTYNDFRKIPLGCGMYITCEDLRLIWRSEDEFRYVADNMRPNQNRSAERSAVHNSDADRRTPVLHFRKINIL